MNDRVSMFVKAYVIFIAVGCVVIGIVCMYAGTAPRDRLLSVSFLDVGQGDAILIRVPDGSTVLVDGGPDNGVLHEIGKRMPWWDFEIDLLIATHADADHYGGLHGVIEKFVVHEMWVPAVDGKDTDYLRLLQSAERSGAAIRRVERGIGMRWPSGVELKVLWPVSGYEPSSDNAGSVAVHIFWGDTSLLLTSDIGTAQEIALTESGEPVVADVLKVSHHGSNTSSDADFLKSVSPRYCIVSAGADNRYGHPSPRVIRRLLDVGCSILETSREGTITFYARPSHLWRKEQ